MYVYVCLCVYVRASRASIKGNIRDEEGINWIPVVAGGANTIKEMEKRMIKSWDEIAVAGKERERTDTTRSKRYENKVDYQPKNRERGTERTMRKKFRKRKKIPITLEKHCKKTLPKGRQKETKKQMRQSGRKIRTTKYRKANAKQGRWSEGKRGKRRGKKGKKKKEKKKVQ